MNKRTPVMADVARLAGVSHQTVSRVVNGQNNLRPATRERVEEAIRQLPEVIACHYISGAGTFELEVMATDLDAFSRFSIDTLLNLPNVKDIHTSFSLGEVKAGGALPLGHLKPKG